MDSAVEITTVVVVIISIMLSWMHADDESRCFPIWYTFAAAANVRLTTRTENVFYYAVSIVLPVVLSVLAVGGMLLSSPSMFSVLWGAKIGDAVLSHFSYKLADSNAINSGYETALFAAAESGFGFAWFQCPSLPAVLAALMFALPVPLLRWFSKEGS